MSAFDVTWVTKPDPDAHRFADTDERIKQETRLDQRAGAQTNAELFLLNSVPFGTVPQSCLTCGLPTWDRVHADGQTYCTSEAPSNDEVDR